MSLLSDGQPGGVDQELNRGHDDALNATCSTELGTETENVVFRVCNCLAASQV